MATGVKSTLGIVSSPRWRSITDSGLVLAGQNEHVQSVPATIAQFVDCGVERLDVSLPSRKLGKRLLGNLVGVFVDVILALRRSVQLVHFWSRAPEDTEQKEPLKGDIGCGSGQGVCVNGLSFKPNRFIHPFHSVL